MDTVSPEQILTRRSYPRPLSEKDKRPPAKDLSHHLSQLSQRRRPSPLKELFQYIHPGILSFAGGFTVFIFPELFRYAQSDVLSARKVERRCSWCCGLYRTKLTQVFSSILYEVHIRTTSTITVPKYPADIPINLSVLLQYGMVTGLPALSISTREFGIISRRIPSKVRGEGVHSCL